MTEKVECQLYVDSKGTKQAWQHIASDIATIALSVKLYSECVERRGVSKHSEKCCKSVACSEGVACVAPPSKGNEARAGGSARKGESIFETHFHL